MRKNYRVLVVGHEGYYQKDLGHRLEDMLAGIQRNGGEIESITPHTLHRNKDDEYLEYIIIYSEIMLEEEEGE